MKVVAEKEVDRLDAVRIPSIPEAMRLNNSAGLADNIIALH